MIQPIVLYSTSTSVLREPTVRVDLETEKDNTLSLVQDLVETMEWVGGLGLAANQLAISKRVCVVKLGEDIVPMINPVITSHSDELEDSEEACLSIPDVSVIIKRYRDVVVKYVEPSTFEEREISVSFPNSVVVQHEIDHLDGKTIIDNLSPMQRNLMANKLKRVARGTVPINYVGLIWKPAMRSWAVVGSKAKLMEMSIYRMKLMQDFNSMNISGDNDGVIGEVDQESEEILET